MSEYNDYLADAVIELEDMTLDQVDEFFKMMENGHEPEFVIRLSDGHEYWASVKLTGDYRRKRRVDEGY